MTDDLAARVEALERKASNLRRWVLVLSAALVGVGVAGASGPKELPLPARRSESAPRVG